MRLALLAGLLITPLVFAAGQATDASANKATDASTSNPLGFSVSNMDRKVSPRQDFYRYATGRWIDRTDIPESHPDVSGFSQLADNLNQQLLGIIRQAASAPPGSASGSRQQVADFYRSAMDLQKIDALGVKPLEADFRQLEKLDSPAALGAYLARLQLGYGMSPLLNAFTSPDPKQSTIVILQVYPGIQALAQDEYTQPAGQRVRDLYLDFMGKMFQSLGDTSEIAQANARTVLSIETELAAAGLTPLQRRDPKTTYNKLTMAELQAMVPAVDVSRFLTGLGITPPDTMLVPDLGGLRAVQKVLATRSAAEVRTLLRWHVLSARASVLGKPWRDHDQEFTRLKNGLVKAESREREVTKAIASVLFHPLSQLYVETYFPESTRREIIDMVAHIRAEFGQRLRSNPWLDEPTRKAALEKLAAVDIQVGYPDKWIDFSSIEIRPDDYFGNVERTYAFLLRRDLAELGKPVKRERFAEPNFTTPIAVNAGYNPQYNSIDITAAIVQPPFFVPGADLAVNYCTIGAVIGHELTHGFDSFGRQFGPAGNLRDWWTPEATARFKQRTDVLVTQYSSFEVLPGLMHNGSLTLTENTADLGGITLAHAALQRALKGKPQKKIDGLTSDQRCFVAWAQQWSYKARPERLRYLVSNDYHSISSIRAVAPLVHLDAFHKAFGIRKGDPMWRAPENRVLIW